MRDRIVELIRVRAGELEDHPANWRTHPAGQRAALRGLLKEIGYADALLARRDAGKLILIDGHLRKSISKDQVVPVLVLDVDEREAEMLLATLDPLASLARPDPDSLSELLARIETSDDAIADLLEGLRRSADLFAGPLQRDPEEIPVSPKPRTEHGDLWLLGDHRLLCGDATSKRDMDQLMGDDRAAVVVTDPPYGVSYVGKTERALRIAGDDGSQTKDLLHGAFSSVDGVIDDGAAIYVFAPAGPRLITFLQAFSDQGWQLRQTLVWDKGRPVLGHGDYHYAHEPIVYGFARSTRRRGRGAGGWYGGNDRSSVIEIPKPAASRDHPTAKPVELIRQLVSNSSRRDHLVLDPFAGSGSTIIACEVLGRRAATMELDPAYCDVAVARFEAATGTKARRAPRRKAG
ncbi:MAG: DNA modification methylase [Actinomycetota bacterium]|nr:DNA modification methylase [Actinomycetota bacterium]